MTEEVKEEVPTVDETHPDHDVENVEVKDDYVDDSEPVEFDESELDDLDFDSVDVNVPVLEGDDD